ncbi:MAG: hypothetical protein BMS9Abin29_1569 [Gemmatimonadota bacterium]|nr:MAG: hypothetical protein BMS9Abin29_1569 [Gemmatimonadota bacterium]
MLGRPRTAMVLYAVAMGYLEAAVVVYLRAIYYPEGFAFPLKPMDPGILAVEIGREVATVVMIFAVAWAAARSGWQTLTGFALIFGVWDIAYYAALWVLLAWPASLFEPDLLFLIPAVWVGPVWAPSLIALTLAAAAWVFWPMDYGVIAPLAWEWALVVAAGGILVATFIVPAMLAGVTHLGEDVSLPALSYPWWGWIAGETLAVFVAVRWWMRGRSTAAA